MFMVWVEWFKEEEVFNDGQRESNPSLIPLPTSIY
jgi:hypothetical protein